MLVSWLCYTLLHLVKLVLLVPRMYRVICWPTAESMLTGTKTGTKGHQTLFNGHLLPSSSSSSPLHPWPPLPSCPDPGRIILSLVDYCVQIGIDCPGLGIIFVCLFCFWSCDDWMSEIGDSCVLRFGWYVQLDSGPIVVCLMDYLCSNWVWMLLKLLVDDVSESCAVESVESYWGFVFCCCCCCRRRRQDSFRLLMRLFTLPLRFRADYLL